MDEHAAFMDELPRKDRVLGGPLGETTATTRC